MPLVFRVKAKRYPWWHYAVAGVFSIFGSAFWGWVAYSALGVGGRALAQTPVTRSVPVESSHSGPVFASVIINPPLSWAMQPINGAPYSAEQKVERFETLADGTHITERPEPQLMYRDSAGRTRTERPLFLGMLSDADAKLRELRIIEITDPVAGVQYTLDVPKRVAHRFLAPSQGETSARMGRVESGSTGVGVTTPATRAAPRPNTNPAPGRSWPQVSHESLGTRVIEGVLAEGTRQTVTTPVGAVGNDRPITRVCETWTSPELKLRLLQQCSDPRARDTTERLCHRRP